MAKATNDVALNVPDAEPVGDFEHLKSPENSKNAEADTPPKSADATATGVAAPVASTDTSEAASEEGTDASTEQSDNEEATQDTADLEEQPQNDEIETGNPLEKREFILVFGPVRHNNVRYESGQRIVLTQAEHVEFRNPSRVGVWEKGKVVD